MVPCKKCGQMFISRDGLCLGRCAGDWRSPLWPATLARGDDVKPAKPRSPAAVRSAEAYYRERGEEPPWK